MYIEQKIFSKCSKEHQNKTDELAPLLDVDRRKFNERADEYPYKCIGLVSMFNKDKVGVGIGTAFQISSTIILTAAHNVFDEK